MTKNKIRGVLSDKGKFCYDMQTEHMMPFITHLFKKFLSSFSFVCSSFRFSFFSKIRDPGRFPSKREKSIGTSEKAHLVHFAVCMTYITFMCHEEGEKKDSPVPFHHQYCGI